jgi:FKBP-type peptidyl-prolyl cis-trans isomerase
MVEPTAEQLTLALESARNGEMPAILSWEMKESERGVRYEELEPGDGISPFYGSSVRMHYYVWLPDGTLVDSTRPDGISTPFEFEPGGRRTIVGWDELVLQLNAGSEAVAVIPWELAYGRNGRRDVPGRTDLVVYVSILRVR